MVKSFLDLVHQKSLLYDQVAGLATAGIPHGAFLADKLEAPMVYVRAKVKSHGRGRCIEGDFKSGQKLLFVEDLVNQGSSLKEAVLAAREEGAVVTDCLSIVDYQMSKSKDILKKLGVNLHPLTNFQAIIDTALSLEIIGQKEYELLINWQKDPKGWSAE